MTEEKNKKSRKNSARDRLINSAYELFNRDGIHKTGIDKIIKNAGVAKMSFYSHFPSKNDLVAEYLKIRDNEWFDLLDSFTKKSNKAEEKLVQVFNALEFWFGQKNFYGCPFVNGLAEFDQSNNSDISSCISGHFDKTCKLIDEILTQMKNTDKELAKKISIIIIGAIVLAQATRSTEPATMAKEATLKLLL